jgi:hypothetical protein
MVIEEEVESSTINQWKSWIECGWREKRDVIKYISEKVDYMVVEEEVESNSIYQPKRWLDRGWRWKIDAINYISEKVE